MLNEKPGSSPDTGTAKNFVEALLRWNGSENNRQMPWKGETDPYKIWLSEIILQQTRVEQGRQYYERFIDRFPTVVDLAQAPEQEVFKLWEGLGYYSRCRNLVHTARNIAENHRGVFPAQYEAILSLKGVGPYTAAAISSFAFNLPYAVLDGNVFRVLSRVFDKELPIDSTAGKKAFATMSQELLPKSKAGEYNQAIMDFGATICKPVPECAACFFNQRCRAFLLNKQALLPVKEKKIQVRERWFHYIVLQYKDRIALRQRTGKDIWHHLFEPLLIEAPKHLSKAALLLHLQKEYGLLPESFEAISYDAGRKQKLTHQTIHFSFLHLRLFAKMPVTNYRWVSQTALSQYPFPRTLQDFLSKNI
jgi:A/G-specific adenine glycosylase